MLENYKILKSNYIEGNGVYLTLRTPEGEPYAEITTNVPPYTSGDIIALSHNFVEYCDKELIDEVIEKITESYMFSVQSGFVELACYKLKSGILDTIESL